LTPLCPDLKVVSNGEKVQNNVVISQIRNPIPPSSPHALVQSPHIARSKPYFALKIGGGPWRKAKNIHYNQRKEFSLAGVSELAKAAGVPKGGTGLMKMVEFEITEDAMVDVGE
jgi:hypothetical protein